MSGYLYTLARRSAGVASLALPRAPAPSVEFAGDAEADQSLPVTETPHSHAVAGGRPDRVARDVAPSVPSHGEPHRAATDLRGPPPAHVPPPRDARETAAPPLQPASLQPAPVQPAQPQQHARETASTPENVAVSPRTREDGGASLAQPAPIDAPGIPPAVLPRANTYMEEPAQEVRGEIDSSRAEPAPGAPPPTLMPRTPRDTDTPPTAPPHTQRAEPRAPARASGTVHVRIGRIEVRAPSAPHAAPPNITRTFDDLALIRRYVDRAGW